MIAIVVKKVGCFSGGSRSGVAGGVSDDCRGGWDVCGGEYKDACGTADNSTDGENHLWFFEFSCIYIWNIFEANLVFQISIRYKGFLYYKYLSKKLIFFKIQQFSWSI